MDAAIPKIKKKVTSFLVGEEGKISKKSIFKVGVVLGAVALSSSLVTAGHTNTISGNTHQHMLSHASHASHGSHGHHTACQPSTC